MISNWFLVHVFSSDMCNTYIYIFYIYAIGFRGTFSTLFADTYKSISHNTWMFSWISVVISAKMTKPLASCGMAWFSHVFPFFNSDMCFFMFFLLPMGQCYEGSDVFSCVSSYIFAMKFLEEVPETTKSS